MVLMLARNQPVRLGRCPSSVQKGMIQQQAHTESVSIA